METSCINILPHPRLLQALFAYKKEVSTVFKDIFGLHDIDHVAISRVNHQNQLLIFSSTPALEFNLFNGSLWAFDQTYNPEWFQAHNQSCWQNLYTPDRYDELYYLKQIKHNYPVSLSITAKTEKEFLIYSFASMHDTEVTRDFFAHNYDDFYKMGHYCSKMLASLFARAEG